MRPSSLAAQRMQDGSDFPGMERAFDAVLQWGHGPRQRQLVVAGLGLLVEALEIGQEELCVAYPARRATVPETEGFAFGLIMVALATYAAAPPRRRPAVLELLYRVLATWVRARLSPHQNGDLRAALGRLSGHNDPSRALDTELPGALAIAVANEAHRATSSSLADWLIRLRNGVVRELEIILPATGKYSFETLADPTELAAAVDVEALAVARLEVEASLKLVGKKDDRWILAGHGAGYTDLELSRRLGRSWDGIRIQRCRLRHKLKKIRPLG